MEGPQLARHESLCLTVVVDAGLDVAALCRRLGQDPASLRSMRPDQAYDLREQRDWKEVISFVQVKPDSVVMVEDNGWQGSDPRVLEGATAPAGMAVSAYWSVNWDNRYSVAVHGRLLGSLDYSEATQDDAAAGPLAADLTVVRKAAAAAPDGWKQGYLSALESRTNVSLPPDLLLREHPTLVVRELLPPQPKPPPGMLAHNDYALWLAVRSADEAHRCAAFAIAAQACASFADVDGDEDLAVALVALGQGRTSEEFFRAGLMAAVKLDEAMVGKPTPDNLSWLRLQAGAALHALLKHRGQVVPGLREELAQVSRWDGLVHAMTALGDEWPAVRQRVLERLKA